MKTHARKMPARGRKHQQTTTQVRAARSSDDPETALDHSEDKIEKGVGSERILGRERVKEHVLVLVRKLGMASGEV